MLPINNKQLLFKNKYSQARPSIYLFILFINLLLISCNIFAHFSRKHVLDFLVVSHKNKSERLLFSSKATLIYIISASL